MFRVILLFVALFAAEPATATTATPLTDESEHPDIAVDALFTAALGSTSRPEALLGFPPGQNAKSLIFCSLFFGSKAKAWSLQNRGNTKHERRDKRARYSPLYSR